ncbi:MAG: hypothetical protein WAU57_11740 [Xanthobacteraceae bacterium]
MLKRLNPEISLGFLLATILWIGVLGWSLSYAPTDVEKQDCQQAAKAAGHKTEECKTLWERTTSDPVAFFTFVLSISTIALFASTAALWFVTRRSANIAERALTDLERPYIFFDAIQTNLTSFFNLLFDPYRMTPEFWLDIVNYGRTPGNFEEGAIFYEVGRFLPDEFVPPEQISLASPHSELAEIIVGPDKTYRFPSQRIRHIFTKAHARGVEEETMFVYCHGFITYSDIFRRKHTTKFCRRYDASRGEWLPEGGRERNRAD